MAVYRPDDPLNWLGISLSQQGVDEQGRTRYTLPDMALDPEYIAFLTQYDQGVTTAKADADLRRTRSRDAYEQALKAIEQQGLDSARAMDTGLLSRGVFASGERLNRQEDLRRMLSEGRSQADTTMTSELGGIDNDLQRALGQLDTERERQIVLSQARISNAQRQGAIDAGVYGSGSGGSGGGSGGSGGAGGGSGSGGGGSGGGGGGSGSGGAGGSSGSSPSSAGSGQFDGGVYDSFRPPTGPATPPKPPVYDSRRPPTGPATPRPTLSSTIDDFLDNYANRTRRPGGSTPAPTPKPRTPTVRRF